MENVFVSLDLDILADDMILKIMEEWKNPFEPPAVIFSDVKTEQWFRLRFLNNPESGKTVLMNLEALRLQPFLFELLLPGKEILFEKYSIHSIEKLSVELLRDVIIQKLTDKLDDNTFYFESLNAPQVTDYIKKSEINPVCLYDFAQEIATLFLDYEDTRSNSLQPLLESCAWQKKLYDDIFNSSGQAENSKKNFSGIVINQTAYLSLYQLYELNKKLNGGKLNFNWKENRAVYVFGFSGMGEIYRSILQEFSKAFKLTVYLQTSSEIKDSDFAKFKTSDGKAFSSECKNLFTDWASYGTEHFELWKKNAANQNPEISLNAAPEENCVVSLSSAPNQLREIENLHSQICELLKSGRARVCDILVLAQNIQSYKVAIEQVFEQNNANQKSENSKEENQFPYIPTLISDYDSESSFTTTALITLFGILQKKYLCRSDIFSLLRNPLVQFVRGFTNEMVSAWAEWVDKLNAYRDHGIDKDRIYDWQKLKNRLMLSRLTEDLIIAEAEKILPYENIETQNDYSLYKFIEAIDELEEWMTLSAKQKFNLQDIEFIYEFLMKWLNLSNEIPPKFFSENFIFQNVIEEIERQKMTSKNDVYSTIFANSLFDRAKGVSLHSANIFSQGITFAKFAPNRILSADYVFFLGMDSSFPGTDSENVLDLRSSHFGHERQKGDEKNSLKNRNAFLCQMFAARKGLFISYVNKNLKKDQDFYPSSVVLELFGTVYKGAEFEKRIFENKISIDESRPWNELFTKREFRNKINYELMRNSSVNEEEENFTQQSEMNIQNALPDRVRFAAIKKYLEEPYKYYIENIFDKSEDDSVTELQQFEPLTFNNLTESVIQKEYLNLLLKTDESEIEDICFDLDFKENLKLQNVLPVSFFGEKALADIRTKAEAFYEQFKIIFGDLSLVVNEMAVNIVITQPQKKQWELSGKLVSFNKDFYTTKNLTAVEISKQKKFLNCYISSLALIASLPESDVSEYTVNLVELSYDDSKKEKMIMETQTITLSRKESIFILQNIYNSMFVENFYKCVPFSEFNNEHKTLTSLTNKLESIFGGEWAYFAKKKLFDLEHDLGYTAENFSEEWMQAVSHQKMLIKYLNDVE